MLRNLTKFYEALHCSLPIESITLYSVVSLIYISLLVFFVFNHYLNKLAL
jgi:hypothetical protein